MTNDRVAVAARCAGLSSCRIRLGSLVEAETVPQRIRIAFGAAGTLRYGVRLLG
jgi:purine-nucleoside phosphorylase